MRVTFDRRKKVVDERVQGTFGDALRNPALSQSSVRVVVVGQVTCSSAVLSASENQSRGGN
jgi:hypothetical protein